MREQFLSEELFEKIILVMNKFELLFEKLRLPQMKAQPAQVKKESSQSRSK